MLGLGDDDTLFWISFGRQRPEVRILLSPAIKQKTSVVYFDGNGTMVSGNNIPSRKYADIKPELAKLYDENFYEFHVTNSIQSARIYLKYLWQYFRPVSVLDVGCGRGAWLKVCHELGSEILLGLDGNWNNPSLMIDSAINFRNVDLNKPFSVLEKVDMVMTLEVAEHLESSIAAQFVKCLTKASDVVLFSAAYVKQGGTSHINEQPHTYWADLFAQDEFVPFDLFRPVFWGNENVDFWYRQNTFLYLKKNSAPYQKIKTRGLMELADISFMNCIHPDLYALHIDKPLPLLPSFRNSIADLIPSFWRALNRRLQGRE
jgi:SAM-dependent methyltransferase